ncbi:MAG: hypothetical protein HY607_06970 [Planctomycetes bacterium]|uniref:hypothetical protein n=1 Tax=Candidatus Wunengus californicus TaxID=3367619 RepID=UPI004026D7A4|nr:hypothetical protein [Planctomycetota bacterium]
MSGLWSLVFKLDIKVMDMIDYVPWQDLLRIGIEYEGALYYVTSRGNAREPIRCKSYYVSLKM